MNDLSDLVDLFSFSHLLAQRWRDYTPEMDLAWNPRSERSAIEACTRWQIYVSQNLFPIVVSDLVDELESMKESLLFIFPEVMGFDTEDLSLDDVDDGADRLFYLLYAAHDAYGGEAATCLDALASLGFRIELNEVVSLATLRRGLRDRLAGGGLPAAETALWQGCLHLMGFYLNDTGASYLDIPYTQMYSGGYEIMSWDPAAVALIREDWAKAKTILDELKRFADWAKDEKNFRYLVRLLLELADEQQAASVGDEEE